MNRSLGILVERELRTRVRDRTFVISTVVSLLVVVGVAVLPKLFAGDPSTWQIGAIGAPATEAADLAAAAAPEGRQAEVVPFASAAEAEAALRAGDVTVVVADGGALVGDEQIDAELQSLLQGAWRQQALTGALTEAGVPATEASAIAATPPGPVRLLDPPDEERDRHVGFVVVGVILLYGQLVGYGYAVASGVVEEKASRVVEVLLAKVRPRELLAAKVLGIGAIGLGQLALFVGVGLGAFVAADRFDLPPGVWPSAAGLLGWFVLGFLLYAAMFAVSGALAARAEDLQSSSGPITLVIATSFIGAITAGADPAGTLARVLSFVPSTTPMVMPIRAAHGEVPWWEIGAGITIVVATGLLLVRIADVVYARSALRTGGRTRLREALRAV